MGHKASLQVGYDGMSVVVRAEEVGSHRGADQRNIAKGGFDGGWWGVCHPYIRAWLGEAGAGVVNSSEGKMDFLRPGGSAWRWGRLGGWGTACRHGR